MRSLILSSILALPALAGGAPAQDQLKLAALFTDHMVLQHGTEVPIWGWARPGQEVAVNIAARTAAATAGKDGRWQVKVGPIQAGGPVQMQVTAGEQTVVVRDILVGLVWLCSGQSNMNWRVRQSRDFDQERAAANHPAIRMFTVQRAARPEPAVQCEGGWQICNPDTVGDFSATAYFFGRKLQAELDLPVGLIHSSWGGTAIEAWTSMQAQQQSPALKGLLDHWAQRAANYSPQQAQKLHQEQLARWKKRAAKAREAGTRVPRRPRKASNPRNDQNHPAALYNGMIAPLLPYAIDGVIWYQGERNARNDKSAHLYRHQLPLLIDDWRARFGRGPIPFIWAQLPNFKKRQNDPNAPSSWALMRESMLKSLSVKHTGMAITIDIGEADNIHPKNKQDVGLRLANWALTKHYHRQDSAASGPVFAQASKRGAEFVIWFQCAEGLRSSDERPLTGFAMAGKDKMWHWAKARVEDNTVVVSCAAVPDPVAVRYAWGDNPDCNLVNVTGMPASPFRTDDW